MRMKMRNAVSEMAKPGGLVSASEPVRRSTRSTSP